MNESLQGVPLQRDRLFRSEVVPRVIVITVIALAWSTAASAAIDSYWISQLFSNADRSVQYIQFDAKRTAQRNGASVFFAIRRAVR